MKKQDGTSEENSRKKPFYKNWHTYAVLIIVIIAIFGIKSYSNYRHWSAPYYNETGSHVLLSDKVDKLNDDQKEAFYGMAKHAIQNKDSKIDFDNLKDKGLYVEKLNKKKTYHIEYVCQSDLILKMNFRTSMNITLNKNSLKEDSTFNFYDYKSDLTDFTTASDKSATSQKKKSTVKKSNSKSSSSNSFTKINKKIASSLAEDQGFANGTLDKDGNPTENGTPNEDFNWSLYIKSINYAKDKSFEIKVIDQFTGLTSDEKKKVIDTAQNSALAAVGEVSDVSTETYQNGLFTTISLGSTDIGHSKVSNYKDFKWE